jgi:hypothetical protein
MEHHILESTMTPAERRFLDLMRHGDNFLKIELLRPAKSYYKKALELNLETEKVKEKIAVCDKLLAFEIRVIWILAAIAAVIVLTLLIL